MTDEPWAGLAEAVGAIRAELQQAIIDGKNSGRDLHFRAGPVEMEFAVEVKKDAQARTKVLVLPWSVEAKAGYGTGRTHRLKVVLQPIDEHGEDAQISASSTERPN